MKKNLILIVSLMMAMNALAVVTWDGTSTAWTEGVGTAASPYVLSSPAHLAYLAQQVNAGTTYSGKYFKQTQDFNLNSKTWTSIGTSTNKFAGNYDGNGKYISNLTNSIFGYINNAEIKNLTLQGANLTAQSTLVNTTAGTCRIINCHNKINVTASSASCGGLVLTAGGTSLEMRSCTNTGTYGCNYNSGSSSSVRLGGLIAISSAATLQLTSCSNTGESGYKKVSTNGAYLAEGGLVGDISSGNATILQCYSIHTATTSFTTGSTHGLIVGSVASSAICTIRSSYGKGKTNYFLYGSSGSSGSTIKILGCYLIGTIDSSVGMSQSQSLALNDICSNCYIAGSLPAVNISSSVTWRGEECFYAPTNGASPILGSAVYVSTEAIKKANFIPRINERADEEYFTMDYEGINDGYPILKWQAGTRYKLTASCDANRGTVSGGGEYPNGYSAKLTATPKEGCMFVGWSDGNTDNPRTVTVSGNANYTAQFTKSSYTIYVNQDGTSNIE